MDTNTSIGPEQGSNEDRGNADGCGNKTLGASDRTQTAPDMPAGVAGTERKEDFPRAARDAYPDGPNVETSPWELDAARGKLPESSPTKK